MPDVTLRPGNPGPVSPTRMDSLHRLGDDLREEGFDTTVDPQPPPSRDITWYEVTLIYLGGKLLDAVAGNIVDGAIAAIRDRVVAWAKARAKGGGEDRPQMVHLYAPDGSVLTSVRIENGEAVDG